jgi:hypothetical protein
MIDHGRTVRAADHRGGSPWQDRYDLDWTAPDLLALARFHDGDLHDGAAHRDLALGCGVDERPALSRARRRWDELGPNDLGAQPLMPRRCHE